MIMIMILPTYHIPAINLPYANRTVLQVGFTWTQGFMKQGVPENQEHPIWTQNDSIPYIRTNTAILHTLYIIVLIVIEYIQIHTYKYAW